MAVDFGELMTLLFVTSGKVGRKQQANLTPLLNGGKEIQFVIFMECAFYSEVRVHIPNGICTCCFPLRTSISRLC